jgi:hypothetical protein
MEGRARREERQREIKVYVIANQLFPQLLTAGDPSAVGQTNDALGVPEAKAAL